MMISFGGKRLTVVEEPQVIHDTEFLGFEVESLVEEVPLDYNDDFAYSPDKLGRREDLSYISISDNILFIKIGVTVVTLGVLILLFVCLCRVKEQRISKKKTITHEL